MGLKTLDLFHFYSWTENVVPALHAAPTISANLSSLNFLRLTTYVFKDAELASNLSSHRNLQQLYAVMEVLINLQRAPTEDDDPTISYMLQDCNQFCFLMFIRHGLVFVSALVVCAEHGGTKIKPLVGESLSKLNNVISHPSAFLSDNRMATDNAISAPDKICEHQRDCIDALQVVPAWLSCLPIKNDVIEAKVLHELLCSMAERSDPPLFSPRNQYLPKIISIFAEILCAGVDLALEETISRIVQLLRQL